MSSPKRMNLKDKERDQGTKPERWWSERYRTSEVDRKVPAKERWCLPSQVEEISQRGGNDQMSKMMKIKSDRLWNWPDLTL